MVRLMEALTFMIAAVAAQAADAPSGCTLKRVASLDASTNRGRLLINIKLNGRDSSVMVDTGSPFNLISADLATELKLPLHTAREGATFDASGNSFRHYVTVEKLEIGGMSANDVLFLVMGENSPQKGGVDGIFGANFLAAYDVELDLAHGKLNLFLQNRCDAPPVYWTQDYDSVRFQLDASLHPVLPVSLDGQELQAILDTGATLSTLSAQVAKHRFNIDPIGDGSRPDAEERAGTGHELPVFGHGFRSSMSAA
jgi:predicted aspartyl protease